MGDSVNEIFDPDRVDEFYSKPVNERIATVSENKQTNYSVVRIGLLEHLYSGMYMQRLQNPDSSKWQHQMLNYTSIVKVEERENGVRLHLKDSRKYASSTLDVDAVMVAAGYKRDIHETMLAPCRSLMPANAREKSRCSVTRDYRVEMEGGTGNGTGVWLTGSNEDTHGVSLSHSIIHSSTNTTNSWLIHCSRFSRRVVENWFSLCSAKSHQSSSHCHRRNLKNARGYRCSLLFDTTGRIGSCIALLGVEESLVTEHSRGCSIYSHWS